MRTIIMGSWFDRLMERAGTFFGNTFWFHLHTDSDTPSTQEDRRLGGTSTSLIKNDQNFCQSGNSHDMEINHSECVDSEMGTPLVDALHQQNQKGPSCMAISIYSAVMIAMICVFLVLGRDYIKYLLLSLEETSMWISFLIFALLFTIVSFPMTWGYILLNIAAGYLYGFYMGLVIILLCALFGLLTAHTVIRRFFSDFVRKRLLNDGIRAIMRVVDSDQGFRIVFLARLTPIPFGLQNALFAISQISTARFLTASLIGMFPTQGMHAYVGSTLRSMEEVISSSSNSFTGQLVFIAQILAAVVLLFFVIRRAKAELNRAVGEVENPDHESSSESSSTKDCNGFSNLDSVSVSVPRSPSESRHKIGYSEYEILDEKVA